MEDANGISQLGWQKREDWARRILVRGLAICALISVALYNGYPTVFSDTGSYLLTGKFFVAFAPFRAPGYSIFTNVASLGISAWFTIAAQAIMTVYVLHEIYNYLLEADRRYADLCFLLTIGALAAMTSLPWLVSLLMPDVFAGVLFLAAFLLAFARELPLFERILLAAILMVSIAAHASLFPIAILFVVVAFVLRRFSRSPQALPTTRSAAAWLLVPIVASAFLTMELNRETGLGFQLSPSRDSFMMARLYGDGLAADFLRENCPQRHFVSCRYLAHLPRTEGEFLFWHPLYPELLKGHQEEMAEIVRGTLLAYPIRFLASSAKETLLQLATLRTGEEIRSYGAKEWNSSAIPRVFPGDVKAFTNARQYRSRMASLADASAAVDTTIFCLSLATCLYLAGTGRFRRLNLFFYSALAFLVINASVCASFSGVYDRYQSRVAWIVPFCLAGYLGCLARDWKPWSSVESVEELGVSTE